MTAEQWWEWRYLAASQVSHALRPTGVISPEIAAQCGIFPRRHADWLGTGNQNEYERAKTLPKCVSCLRKIGGLW